MLFTRKKKFSLHGYLSIWLVRLGIHMNCNFQGFPAEYCIVGKGKEILVLNAVKGFNVLADEWGLLNIYWLKFLMIYNAR